MSNFRPSRAPDTDGDGLPDDVELAIGTNPNRVDTDGDGLNDFAELDTGSNPLDDRPTVTGVTAALNLGGKAHDVKLLPDFRDNSKTLAYVASGSAGLNVAEHHQFRRTDYDCPAGAAWGHEPRVGRCQPQIAGRDEHYRRFVHRYFQSGSTQALANRCQYAPGTPRLRCNCTTAWATL